MKSFGAVLFCALAFTSFAKADNASDFAKLNSSLDTSVDQGAKKQAEPQQQQQQASADPNLKVAPIRKSQSSRDPSSSFGSD